MKNYCPCPSSLLLTLSWLISVPLESLGVYGPNCPAHAPIAPAIHFSLGHCLGHNSATGDKDLAHFPCPSSLWTSSLLLPILPYGYRIILEGWVTSVFIIITMQTQLTHIIWIYIFITSCFLQNLFFSGDGFSFIYASLIQLFSSACLNLFLVC